MTTIGTAVLQIIPSLDGVSSAVQGQLRGLPEMGRTAGRQLGDGLASGVDAAAKKVEAATSKIAAANKKVEDSAGKVRVAEAQLQSLRDRGITDAGRLAAAEEKIAAAQRNLQTASASAANAASSLERAQNQLTEASERAAAAQREVGRAGDETASRHGVLSGATSKLGDAFSGVTGKAKELASAIGPAALGAGAGAAVAAIGSALVSVGSTFDDVIDTIRVGTGASGEALDGLVASAKKIGTEVPADFATIGTTVSDLNTRLGLTGQPLETLTKQFVELGRITGEEVDINGVTAAFQAFGVQGADTAGAMDELFRVSQATGVGMNELSAAAVKGAPQLKQFGFSLSSSAAIVGQLDKAGIDSQATLGAMGKAMVNLAKDGKSGQQALYEVVVGVEDLIAKGDEAGAINSAGKVFGTKGAAQFVEAIRAGTLSVDDFMAASGASQDTILGLGEETADFAEQWQLFKNKVLVGIEPIASKVFGLIGDGMSRFADIAVPAMQTFGQVAQDAWNSSVVQTFVDVLTGLGSAIGTVTGFLGEHKTAVAVVAGVIGTVLLPQLITTSAMMATVGAAAVASSAKQVGAWVATQAAAVQSGAVSVAASYKIVGGWVAAGAGATVNAAKIAAGWVAAGAGAAGAAAKTIAYGVAQAAIKTATVAWTGAQWLLNAALNANPISLIVIGLAALVAGIVLAYQNSETFRDIVAGAWNWIKEAALSVVSWFTDTAWPALQAVWEGIKAGWNTLVESAQAVGAGIRDKFTQMVDFVTGLPGRIKAAAGGMWDGIRDAFKGAINWIIRAWNSLEFKIPGFKVGPVGYDGFTLGVPDLPEFFSGGHTGPGSKYQVAGVVHADEFVLSKRARGMLESAAPGGLDFMNQTGRWPGYAEGGRVQTAEGLNPGADYLRTLIMKKWPEIKTIGGRRSEDGYGEHSSGNALDVMIPNYASPEGKAIGDAVLAFLQQNAAALQLDGAIWQQASFGYGGSLTAGKPMDSRGSDTQNHLDHLHVILGKGRGEGAAPTEVPTGLEGAPAQAPAATAAAAIDTKPSDSKADDKKTTDEKAQTSTPAASSGGGGSYPTSISGWAGFIGENFVGGQIKSLLSVFGIPDSPSWMKAGSQLIGGIKVADKDGKSLFDGSNPLAGTTGAIDGKQQTPAKKTDDSTAGPGAALPLTGQQPAPAAKATETLTSSLSAPKADYKGGSQATYDAVYKAYRDAGFADAMWPDYVQMVNRESAWNPEARNPSSGAYGLAQFLGQGNVDKYLGGSSSGVPVDVQAKGMMAYIKDRYGDPSKAWEFWQKNNWYADGGRVKPFLYDAGGLLPQGVSLVENRSGGPEPILTQDYWSTAKSAIDVATSIFKGQAGGQQKQLPQINYNIQARDTEDAFIRAQRQERERAAAKLSRF